MRTYPIKDREGRLFAFEVDNLLLGRRGLARVVGSLSGVRIRRRPKFLSWFREEEFCEHVGEAFARRSPLHILVGA